MKTGDRLVKHARYYWLLLAEGHLNRRLFSDMLQRIWALPLPSGCRLDGECEIWTPKEKGRRGV